MSRNTLEKVYLAVVILLTPVSSLLAMMDVLTTGTPTKTNETNIANSEISMFEPVRHRLKDKPLGSSHISSFSLDRFMQREPLDGKGSNCRRPAKCEKLNHNSCFGVKLPYSSTTLDLVDDVKSQDQVMEKLTVLSDGLRQIPKCWAAIQPLLCSLYMPRCEDDMVDLPSQEMCNMTIWPCRTLLSNNNWPTFPKCEEAHKFPPKCRNDVRELRFNTTGQCQAPLVQTDNSFAFYEGVEGCGIQCREPLFTDHEQQQLYTVIAYGGAICLSVNLFTVITFLIEWKSANKYPSIVIFYINCCFLISCIGWLVQFIPNERQNIVCRKDGTLRMDEPRAVENISCVIIFALVYYPIMASLVWFVILTYTWHISFQSVGKIHENIVKKRFHFHMAAWCIPVILSASAMVFGQIDGSSVAGICFVGYINYTYRVGYLWGPIIITLLISAYFIFKVLYALIMLKISSQDIVSELATAKIQKTIVRIALFSLFMLVLVITSFICHVYEFLNHEEWKESFRKLIICKVAASSGLSSTHMDPRQCRLESRPSVSMFQLHLLVFFCAGIIMSSWVWTGSTVRTWKRFLRRKFGSKKEEPVKMKRHKAIAQAFANWKTFNNDGRLSINFHSSHEDPVGLNLDVNSVASWDFSSTWAAALPTLMTRRGALVTAGSSTYSNSTDSCHRTNSLDSEINVSVRKFSMGTRRSSLDSQVSVQISELTAITKTKGCCKHVREPNKKRRRKDLDRTLNSHMVPFSRTGSSTSQESHLGPISGALPFNMSLFPSLTPSIPAIPKLPQRRHGISGADGFKFPLPFTLPGQSSEASDDSDNDANKIMEEGLKLKEITRKKEEDEEALADEVKEDDQFLPEVIQLPLENGTVQKGRPGNRNDNGYKLCAPQEGGRKSRTSEKSHSRNSNENRGSKKAVRRTESGQEKLSRNAESEGCRSANKRKLEEIQVYQSEESENEEDKCMKDCSLPSMDITALSETSSFCPELMRLMGANSGASIFTHHTLGGGRVRTVGVGPHLECNDVGVQVSPQEIATQTSDSLEDMEVECLLKKQHSPQQFVSQGVQVSPSLLRPRSTQKMYINNAAPYDEKLAMPGSRALDCNYTLQILRELTEGHKPLCFVPAQLQQQKTSMNRNGYRSRSAEDKVEGYFVPV